VSGPQAQTSRCTSASLDNSIEAHPPAPAGLSTVKGAATSRPEGYRGACGAPSLTRGSEAARRGGRDFFRSRWLSQLRGPDV